MNDFYEKNKDKINVIMIYITEAHATDVWNIGESAGALNESHKCIEERITCAKNMESKYKLSFPIYADNMSDDFENKYSGWPFRYYIANGKILKHIGMPEDSEFDLTEIFSFLKSNGIDLDMCF
jgi:hypothetical protein